MSTFVKSLILLFAGLLLGGVTASNLVAAAPGDALAKDINTALRTAEKHTFSGNYVDAAAIATEAAAKLAQLEATDPGNRNLKSLLSKHSQLQKKIDRNNQQASGAAATTAPAPVAAKTPAPPKPPTPPTAAVPAAVATPVASGGGELAGVAAIAVNGMVGHLDRAETTMQAGTGDLGRGSLKRAADRYQEIEKKHGTFLGHPQVVAAKARLDQLLVAVDEAAARQQAGKEDAQAAAVEQRRLEEEWSAVFRGYTTPREEKYLELNPQYIDEAKERLAEYRNTVFPQGVPPGLADNVKSVEEAISRASAGAAASAIDEAWQPRIKPLLSSNEPTYLSPGGPDFSQPELVARMDQNLAAAKALLAEYDQQFAGGHQSHFTGQDIDRLREAVAGYEEGRQSRAVAALTALSEEVARGQQLHARNEGWNAQSGEPIYIVNTSTMQQIVSEFDRLQQTPGYSAEALTALGKEIEQLQQQDQLWRQKKSDWENAPKPFPAEGMVSKSLTTEMEKILADRGVGPVEKLVIVDRDWWVQQGEFRYLKAAALQKDQEGPFFTYVTFRQLWSLGGYGPTELWEQGKVIRVAK